MKYYKSFVGEKCFLSPLFEDDAPLYAKWLNDFEITKNLGSVAQVVGIQNEKDFIASVFKSETDRVFAIIESESEKAIGLCGLHKIDKTHGLADYGILIGEKGYHGKGIGTEAGKLIIDYAFNVLNLRNIRLSVFEFNKRGIASYEKIGFKHIGRRRKAWPVGGKAYDIIFMDIIAEEFESPYIKKVMGEGEKNEY